VGFANVNGQKIGVIPIVVKDLHDVANLATERRSSEATENQDQRFSGGAIAYVKSIGSVEREQFGVGSAVPWF